MQANTSEPLTDATLALLQDLAKANLSLIKFIEEASKQFSYHEAKKTCTNMLRQHRVNVVELNGYIQKTGESAVEGSVYEGILGRIWLNVHSMTSGAKNLTILTDVKREESLLIERYTIAESETAGSNVHQLIAEQRERLDNAICNLDMLISSLEA